MTTTAPTGHLVHKCQICHPRGGCLGTQLLDDQRVSDKLKQAKRICRKGEHVFREGDPADALYVVRSGSVKSYMVTENGEEQVLGFFLAGDVFGLDNTADDLRGSSAILLETASLCRFPFAYLDGKSPGTNLLRICAEKMRHDHNLVLMLARKDADGRIAGFLEDLARRHWSRGYSANAFLLSMSRQDIGCYLGLAVETVSRTLTRFQECGVLRVNRREVEILDHALLCRIAGIREATGSPGCVNG